MANDYYYHSSGVPATGSSGSSSTMRTELDAVAAGFDKLPALTGNPDEFVVVNAGASALTSKTAAEALTLMGAQASDATLTSLAALGTGADKYAYTTGVDTWAEGDITAAGRAILDDADAAAQRTTLNAQEDVITTRGDIIRGSSAGDPERLALGAAGYYLRSDGTDVQWRAPVYGGRTTRTTSVGVGSAGWDEDVGWGAEDYDTASCLSTYAGGGLLITVPNGVSYMEVIVHPVFSADATGVRGAALYSCDSSGGSGTLLLYRTAGAFAGAGIGGPPLVTGPLAVTPGTYYKTAIYNNSAGVTLDARSFVSVVFR